MAIFFDDLDVLAGSRQQNLGVEVEVKKRLITTLLNEIDGLDTDNTGILVVGAASELKSVDEALTRPGRLQVHLKIRDPSFDDLREIFVRMMDPYKSSVDVDEVASGLAGLSVIDIERIVQDSTRIAQRRLEQGEGEEEIMTEDVLTALGTGDSGGKETLREELEYFEGMLGHVGNSGKDAAFEKSIEALKIELDDK